MHGLTWPASPLRIFKLVDRITEKAFTNGNPLSQTVKAVIDCDQYAKIVRTAKKEIEENPTLMIEIFGTDLVNDIIKY